MRQRTQVLVFYYFRMCIQLLFLDMALPSFLGDR